MYPAPIGNAELKEELAVCACTRGPLRSTNSRHNLESSIMLCVNNYTQKYIDECRSRIAEHVSAYQTLIAAARNHAGIGALSVNAAIEAFEPHFFSNLVLALESYFVHRARALEERWQSPE